MISVKVLLVLFLLPTFVFSSQFGFYLQRFLCSVRLWLALGAHRAQSGSNSSDSPLGPVVQGMRKCKCPFRLAHRSFREELGGFGVRFITCFLLLLYFPSYGEKFHAGLRAVGIVPTCFSPDFVEDVVCGLLFLCS